MKRLILVLFLMGLFQFCNAQDSYIIESITGWKPANNISQYETAAKSTGFLVLAIWGFHENTNYGCITGFYFTYKFGVNICKYSFKLK